METQRQTVQVLEHLQGHAPDGALHDLGEHGIAQLAEQRVGQAQCAVAHQQKHRQHQQGARAGQRVDHLLEQQRHTDVGDLGGDQKTHGQQHPSTEFP
jgi:hypothetical protein